jgi:aarF domain-containing kinase
MRENLPNELDFTREAANCTAASAAFAHRDDVVAPTVYGEWTTPRVLTMSFEEGVYANNVGAIRGMGLAPVGVSTLVAEAFAEQIFVHGRVHCDPHAANLLIRPMPGSPRRPQLVLLDHGLYRTVPHELRLNYARLWRALIFGDEAGIRKYSEKMNVGGHYKLWAAMLTTKTWDRIAEAGKKGDLTAFNMREGDRERTRANAKAYADEISVVLRKMPRELLLVLKTNDCLRSVDTALGNPTTNALIQTRYIQRAVNQERARLRPGWYTALWNGWETVQLEAYLRAFAAAYALGLVSI